ncbi:hypothetical protein UlMin_014334 [Ulmus minor]
MAEPHTAKLIERSHVSPPPGSVPSTSLRLTFFDLLWHLCCPVQRLYFYHFSHPTHHFLQSILPTLKHSLSLTLQHFFPFAANLILPPPPQNPHILFTEGGAVDFTVTESAADFAHLIADHSKDVLELHPFVPKLTSVRVEDNGNTRVDSLMALQVTIFPNLGISIGVTFCHLAADGRSFHQFMRSWASVFASGCDVACIEKSPPFLNRDVIKVPIGLDPTLLKGFYEWALKENEGPNQNQLAGKVRSTFSLGLPQIEKLKHWINNLEPTLHLSKFVVTCALIWVCLVKSEEIEGKIHSNNDDPYYIVFTADCRNRLEFPIPSNYFGNCLAFCIVAVTKKDLLGPNGIFLAAKVIAKKVKDIESGALKGAEKWMAEWNKVMESNDYVTIAGSTRLGVYKTDFGWGKLKKTESVHADVSGAISLCDSRDDEHGVEVGLALNRNQMDRFIAILEHKMNNIH